MVGWVCYQGSLVGCVRVSIAVSVMQRSGLAYHEEMRASQPEVRLAGRFVLIRSVRPELPRRSLATHTGLEHHLSRNLHTEYSTNGSYCVG